MKKILLTLVESCSLMSVSGFGNFPILVLSAERGTAKVKACAGVLKGCQP